MTAAGSGTRLQETGISESFSAREQGSPEGWGVGGDGGEVKASLGGCALLSTSIYKKRKVQESVHPEGWLGYRGRDEAFPGFGKRSAQLQGRRLQAFNPRAVS